MGREGAGVRTLQKYVPVFTIMAVLSGCGNPAQKPPIRAIRLSHSSQADRSSELHMAAWLFQKLLEDDSDQLKVKIYASNTLGQEREIYEGMQLESGVACAVSGTAILNNFVPRMGVLDLPFLWQDYEHVHRVLDGPVGQILEKELDKAGFKVLAWMDSWGYRNVVTARKPVTTASDLAGLKIRTIPTPLYIATLNTMGCNATPMAFGDVYPGLQTGVIDGFEHSAAMIRANRFYEVADHLVLTRHLFGPLVFVYAKYLWEKLTPAEQNQILDAARMSRDIERSLAPVREQEALRFLEEKGMTIHSIDREVFLEAARRLQDEWAARNGATDLLRMIRETR
ncbi:MAG: TRAP transporter substrate-binding protein [Acidobacteria bacterium]|nr:MAG: TRAP transporter substrate-binding protein [Acidobacteriota bacterium]